MERFRAYDHHGEPQPGRCLARPRVALRRAYRFDEWPQKCAGFLHTALAPALCEGSTVIYLGDWDFDGGHIEANTRSVLEREVGPLNWERLAVFEEQVEIFDLTIIQKYDARTKSHHDAVETEALGQETLVGLVREWLDTLLPEPIETVHERAQAQRAEIEELLKTA